MTRFGKTALKAVRMFIDGGRVSPEEAWRRSAEVVFAGVSNAAEKGCPRCAFLGLCEEGLVRGIPAGKYTRSRLNKDYALQAVKLLRKNPDLASDPKLLWCKVMAGETKQHNGQMDVVVALWKAGLITAEL